jgi:hypothetical protein
MGKHAGKILTRSQTVFFLFVNQNLVYPHFSFLSPDLLSVSLSICRACRAVQACFFLSHVDWSVRSTTTIATTTFEPEFLASPRSEFRLLLAVLARGTQPADVRACHLTDPLVVLLAPPQTPQIRLLHDPSAANVATDCSEMDP